MLSAYIGIVMGDGTTCCCGSGDAVLADDHRAKRYRVVSGGHGWGDDSARILRGVGQLLSLSSLSEIISDL
jgi:hypothetical protein